MSAPPPTRSAAADGVHGEVISDRNLVDGENLRIWVGSWNTGATSLATVCFLRFTICAHRATPYGRASTPSTQHKVQASRIGLPLRAAVLLACLPHGLLAIHSAVNEEKAPDLQEATYVLRVFPFCALVPRVQGSSGAVATVQFVWRGHAETLTTRAGPWPDLAVRLE